MAETSKPIHRLNYGTINAAIWVNSTEELGDFFNVTFSRSFKKDTGWFNSHTYGELDLPTLSKICCDCHTIIQKHKASQALPLGLPVVPSGPNDAISQENYEEQRTE